MTLTIALLSLPVLLPPLSGRVHRILVLAGVEGWRTRPTCTSLVAGDGAPLVAGGGAVHAALVGGATRLACYHCLLCLLRIVARVHWTIIGEVCRVRLKDYECLLIEPRDFLSDKSFLVSCIPGASLETEVQKLEVLASCLRQRRRWRGVAGDLNHIIFDKWQIYGNNVKIWQI